MKTFKLAVMMFVQFLMLPVWLIPLLPYVQGLEGGKDWVFACGLLIGIGTFASPLVGMFADMFRYAAFLVAVKFGFAAGDFAGILVHGLAFGILCVGAQMYIDGEAPGELKNQAQGLVMLLTNGVGLFLSNFVFHLILGANVTAADPLRHDWTVPYATALLLAFAIAVAFAVAFNPKQTSKE